jgi:hypothetical protein
MSNQSTKVFREYVIESIIAQVISVYVKRGILLNDRSLLREVVKSFFVDSMFIENDYVDVLISDVGDSVLSIIEEQNWVG